MYTCYIPILQVPKHRRSGSEGCNLFFALLLAKYVQRTAASQFCVGLVQQHLKLRYLIQSFLE
jgi:hypothetical protein